MRVSPVIWFLVLGTMCSISFVQPESLGTQLYEVGKDMKKSLSPLKSQAKSFFKDLKNFVNGKSSRSLQNENKLINEGTNLIASARRAVDGYAFRILKSILSGYDNQQDKRRSLANIQMRELDPLANLTILASEFGFSVVFCALDKYTADNMTHVIISMETTTASSTDDNSGTTDNTGSGSNPGSDPGSNPSTDPASNPGSDPGSNPSTDPASNPGSDPSPDDGGSGGMGPGGMGPGGMGPGGMGPDLGLRHKPGSFKRKGKQAKKGRKRQHI